VGVELAKRKKGENLTKRGSSNLSKEIEEELLVRKKLV